MDDTFGTASARRTADDDLPGMGPAGGGGGRARRIRLRHALAVAAGLAVGAALVTLVFATPGWEGGRPVLRPRFELGAFAHRLPVHLRWLVPFALAAACLPALRSLVWREVLPAPAPRLADTYHATALGALVHNTVPGKLGPLAAAWLLARTTRRPFTPAFSAQLVAKLLEMGAIVLLGGVAAALSPAARGLSRALLAGAVAFVAFASAAAALALAAPRAAARLRGRFPRAGAALAALGEGLVGAGSTARLAAAAGLAALPALAAASAYALPLRVAGLDHAIAGGAMLVAVITIGQLTPGLPVGTGVYWSLAAWTGRELGLGAADAAAIAVLSHAGMVTASIAVGAASALVRRGALAELVRRRRELASLGARAPPPVARSPRAPTS